MSGVKRWPEFLFTNDVKAAGAVYDRTSKADWCDLYFDLFRQCFGETETGEVVLEDVKRRLEILKTYRKV